MNTYTPYLYKWTEISTGKWYIGSRTARNCHPQDKYICSSSEVKSLIKSNPKNWIRTILITNSDPKKIRKYEGILLSRLDAKNDIMSYNKDNACKKFTTTGMKLSEKWRAKMSASHKGKVKSHQHRENLSISHKGKPKSLEHRKNIGLSGLGRIPWNKGKNTNFKWWKKDDKSMMSIECPGEGWVLGRIRKKGVNK